MREGRVGWRGEGEREVGEDGRKEEGGCGGRWGYKQKLFTLSRSSLPSFPLWGRTGHKRGLQRYPTPLSTMFSNRFSISHTYPIKVGLEVW